MSVTRVTRTLAVLCVLALLGACSEGRDNTQGPHFTLEALPSTTVGLAYEARVTAEGGAPPLTFSVDGVPPGFSFYSDGRLAGPATQAGEWNLTFNLQDATGARKSQAFRLKAWAAPLVTTSAIPLATAGGTYTHTFTATGGQPPLTWEVVDGTLPTGLSLSEDGVMSGVPQGRGLYPFTARVEDANGATAEVRLNLDLRAPGGIDGGPDGGPVDGGPTDAGPLPATFPLKVGNWNLQWFGDPAEEPVDDARQLANVQAVISDAGADFWGLAEVVSSSHFETLKAQLPGYDGFLANDTTRVSSGTGSYSTNEQKVGVLFKSSVVQVRGAQVILTDKDYDFASRPPLRVDLRITRGTAYVDMVAIVLHMKADTSAEDYARRKAAGGWLKAYLDANLPTQRVLVLGDWNDDVDMTIATGQGGTPYQALVDDSTRYTFLTRALSLVGERSTVSFNSFIDHQLATNELVANYVQDSTSVLRPNIPSYRSTTSDHYPIVSRFDFGTTNEATLLRLTAPNGGEVLNAGSTYDITWTSNGVANLRIQYTVDDGLYWRNIATGVAASTGHYGWAVPPEASIRPRIRVTSEADLSVTDASDAPFTLSRPAPQVFVNEYLPHPAGSPPDYDQMFVELRNVGSTMADISGWTLHDEKSLGGSEPVRHVFPSGTLIPAGKSYVVYGGASAVPVGAVNADYASGGDGLRFNRGVNQGSSGDSVYLLRANGQVADLSHYVDTSPGLSYNRSPDSDSAGAWVTHDVLNPSLGASPGLRPNGTAY